MQLTCIIFVQNKSYIFTNFNKIQMILTDITKWSFSYKVGEYFIYTYIYIYTRYRVGSKRVSKDIELSKRIGVLREQVANFTGHGWIHSTAHCVYVLHIFLQVWMVHQKYGKISMSSYNHHSYRTFGYFVIHYLLSGWLFKRSVSPVSLNHDQNFVTQHNYLKFMKIFTKFI